MEIKATDLCCFKEVADVIGEELAIIELDKVIAAHLKNNEVNLIKECVLMQAFIWAKSPQKRKFWINIETGYDPYMNGGNKV